MTAYTVAFEKLGRHDVDSVGGKNSSLGEMISHLANMGVSVPTAGPWRLKSPLTPRSTNWKDRST